MDFDAVMVATVLSSALATIMMGLLANYPFALAAAMGHNVYFVMIVNQNPQISWQTALGAVFISGAIFVATSLIGLREHIVAAVPRSLRNAIAVGIGLLIAFVGLQLAGIITINVPESGPASVALGSLKEPATLLAVFGIAMVAILMSLRVKGAILISILGTAIVGIILKIIAPPTGFISRPPSIAPTFLKLDIVGAVRLGLFDVIFVFFFLDLFDTVGTLIGVGEQGGFLEGDRLPRAGQAFFSDAVGTVAGACLGTSTVTSYIESAAGIAEGGRTGLANMATAVLMLLALLFAPLIRTVGAGVTTAAGAQLNPAVAPALIIVGALIMRNVTKIAWEDLTEAIPSFLAIIVMGLSTSITEGIAVGFISYALLKLVTGRGRRVHWGLYLIAGLFMARAVFGIVAK